MDLVPVSIDSKHRVIELQIISLILNKYKIVPLSAIYKPNSINFHIEYIYMMLGQIIDFINNNSLWVLGIIISLTISIINPKIRSSIKKSFYKIMLRFQDNDVGINTVYVENYEELLDGVFTNEFFEKIRNELPLDQIHKINLSQHFIRIHSSKLGMKLSISVEKENIEIEDKEYQTIPCNVIIEMDADIKGTSNINRLDDFITIAEKIHEIIRIELFTDTKLNSSYVICTINNILNNIDNNSVKSRTVDNKIITYKNNSTSIKSYNPHSITKILKKHAYV